MASGLALVFLLLLLMSIGWGNAHSFHDERDTTMDSIEMADGGSMTMKPLSRDRQDVTNDCEDLNILRNKRSRIPAESLVRKRRLTANPLPGSAHWTTPLTDALPESYLMEIWVGTPPQRFLVVADTGSDLTWLPCPPYPGSDRIAGSGDSCQICVDPGPDCQDCATNATYLPTKSSTFAPLSCSSHACGSLQTPVTSKCQTFSNKDCDMSSTYEMDAFIFGTLVQDTLTMQEVQGGTQTVTDFLFGCSNFGSGDPAVVSQGRVGLGRGTISWPSQLGIYFGNKFGYCLVNRAISSAGEVYSSPLFFGPESVPATPADGSQTLQYTPMISIDAYPSYYYVGCNGISLNGNLTIPAAAFEISSNGSGGIIFDSGALYTTLPNDVYSSLTSALQRQITKYNSSYLPDVPGFCYNVSWSDWVSDYGNAVPNISFQISNTSGFNLSAETAWVQQNGSTCLAFTIQYEETILSRIGNYQQVGYQMLFDLESSQIAFIPANCTSTIFPGIPPNNLGISLVSGLGSPLWVLLISSLVLKLL